MIVSLFTKIMTVMKRNDDDDDDSEELHLLFQSFFCIALPVGLLSLNYSTLGIGYLH